MAAQFNSQQDDEQLRALKQVESTIFPVQGKAMVLFKGSKTKPFCLLKPGDWFPNCSESLLANLDSVLTTQGLPRLLALMDQLNPFDKKCTDLLPSLSVEHMPPLSVEHMPPLSVEHMPSLSVEHMPSRPSTSNREIKIIAIAPTGYHISIKPVDASNNGMEVALSTDVLVSSGMSMMCYPSHRGHVEKGYERLIWIVIKLKRDHSDSEVTIEPATSCYFHVTIGWLGLK